MSLRTAANHHPSSRFRPQPYVPYRCSILWHYCNRACQSPLSHPSWESPVGVLPAMAVCNRARSGATGLNWTQSEASSRGLWVLQHLSTDLEHHILLLACGQGGQASLHACMASQRYVCKLLAQDLVICHRNSVTSSVTCFCVLDAPLRTAVPTGKPLAATRVPQICEGTSGCLEQVL